MVMSGSLSRLPTIEFGGGLETAARLRAGLFDNLAGIPFDHSYASLRERIAHADGVIHRPPEISRLVSPSLDAPSPMPEA